MSLTKFFSDTSAGRYSLALYELAEESKVIEEVEGHSIAIIKLISGSKYVLPGTRYAIGNFFQ